MSFNDAATQSHMQNGQTPVVKVDRIIHSVCKESVSDSPGLVAFALGLVIFVLNLPNGQVLFLEEIQITEGL